VFFNSFISRSNGYAESSGNAFLCTLPFLESKKNATLQKNCGYSDTFTSNSLDWIINSSYRRGT